MKFFPVPIVPTVPIAPTVHRVPIVPIVRIVPIVPMVLEDISLLTSKFLQKPSSFSIVTIVPRFPKVPSRS